MNTRRMVVGKRARRAALALGIVLAVGAPLSAEARWCASVPGPDGGFVSCGYVSWQQCRAALSGQGGICHPDPRR